MKESKAFVFRLVVSLFDVLSKGNFSVKMAAPMKGSTKMARSMDKVTKERIGISLQRLSLLYLLCEI